MKNFQVLRYIKKFLPLIIIFCLLATTAIYFVLSRSNKHIASEIIHYNDEYAEQGLAPNGDTLDVNEIKSSAVMSKVVDKMDLAGVYSVDELISRIDIFPIEDEDKVAQKDAMLKQGEEYTYKPSTYIVSFTAESDEEPEFARKMLEEILDFYFEQFSQNYVNVAPADNTIENINKNNYDYIEMMELIDESISDALGTLSWKIAKNSYYSSSETGVSFEDLAEDFNYLRQVKVASLFSKISKYQVTKNKSILISDYTTRIDNNNISNTKDESIIEDVLTVMDAYVRKMRDSGNTNITHEYILDELHARDLQENQGDQTVTYDELIYSWRDHNESREHAIIDTAYCNYVLDTFTSCTGNCGGICQYSPLTCTELCNPEYTAIREEIEDEIDTLLEELTDLYDITVKTNDEYNKYLGASYISILSSASIKESINVPLYTAIAFIFIMVLCCGGAIILGRIGDIIDYIFYTDQLTKFNNRAYLDNYLNSKDGKLLDKGVVYCMVDISNLVSINKEHSRTVGDEIIKMFAVYIKESFGKSKTEHIYNGNGNFVMLTEDTSYITLENIMSMFRFRLDEREKHREVVIEYKIGIAEESKENKTARKLFSAAIRNKKDYTSNLID